MTFKAEDKRDKELMEGSKDELTEHLRRINGVLKGREYLTGIYSLADIAFTPRVAIFDSLNIQIPTEFKNVIEWIERIKSRPSYQALES
jgi:glutathione S-transferase